MCISNHGLQHLTPFKLHLMIFERLELYKSINSTVENVTIKALYHHTWYLSEELIVFSFFDEQICAATKAEMVQAMKTNVGVENHPKPPHIKENNIASLNPANLVTQNTIKFIETLGVASDWLKNDPNLWGQDSVLKGTRQIVSGLSVVNDRAEGGVALIQEYNQTLTKDEGQEQQPLLQVISEH